MFVIGNWKMNGSYDLIDQFCDLTVNEYSEFVTTSLLVPFPYLDYANKTLNIECGAQDVSIHDSGAFTGSVSSEMLHEVGVKWCCIGHSERRLYHHETSTEVVEKALRLSEKGIRPILCVGESLDDREQGKAFDVVKEQLSYLLSKPAIHNLIVAYEPVWAIGTGKVASEEDVASMHSFIKEYLNNYLANEASVPIIYGGSVKPENAGALCNIPSVDGFLIGGASLKPESFIKVVKLCNNYCSSSIQ